MEIPFDRWYKAIFQRRSRRQFETKQIDPSLFEKLNLVCNEFKPFPEARAILLSPFPERIFKGVVGKYGQIKDAPSCIIFVGKKDDPFINEKIGYTGEGIILEATTLGLATCWVAGFFRADVAAESAQISENERVFAVSPVGYASEKWTFEEKVMSVFGRSHKRKPLNELIDDYSNKNSDVELIKAILEAARLAPSAVNRQPWRFKIEQNGITISTDNLNDTFKISKRLDCGIAMLHIEVACLKHRIEGYWQFLEAPKVAKYRFNKT